MKKILIISLILISVFYVNSFAQSVGFSSPQNGTTITGTGSSNSVSVYFFGGCSLTTYPYPSYDSYLKLIIDPNTSYRSIDNPIPNYFNLQAGTYTWTLELWEFFRGATNFVNTASQTITFNVKYTVSVANNFSGGTMIIDGITRSLDPYSGYTLQKFIGDNISVGAIDQNDGAGYYRIWNTSGTNNSNWYIHTSKIIGATPRNYSYTVASNDNGATLIADLKKICNVTFQNTGHQITINGNSYSSTGTVQSVEGNPVTVSTDSYYNSNGIDYNFSCWTNAGSNYSSPITVSSHSTFTAKYIGTPSNASKNQSYGATFNAPIVVHWTDNPNVNVNQYQIYRKIGDNGTPAIIGTVGRGVQQFTDYDYNRVSDPKQTRLFYDVREYYSIEQTYSPQSFVLVFGSDLYKLKNNEGSVALASDIPTEYKMENYPNPFNPVTVINYQLPQDGFVTLKVYDMLGKEVATVVNEYKNAGYYKVNFDATRLTSGVYIYTINANDNLLSKKMLLMK
jgi:hypothetical protein